MDETPTTVPAATVYRPRRLRMAAIAGISLLIGLTALAAGGRNGEFVVVVSGLVLIGFGLVVLLSAVRGLPRLTLTSEGVELRANFGVRRSAWRGLGPFDVVAIRAGGFGRKVRAAQAAITTNDFGGPTQRRRVFVINNAFHRPIETIVADLNAYREAALGGAAAAAALAPEPEPQLGVSGFTRPWLTLGILGVLLAGFAAEQFLAVLPGSGLLRPHSLTLVALGGLSRRLVEAGEGYRLFTGPLLHLDLPHLAFNGLALVMAGYLLERLVGRRWFGAIYVVGALGGSLASIVINPATTTSVGASGAIMGTFAAVLVASFRYPKGSIARGNLQSSSIQVLLPSMVPLATSGGIDYAAHGGGAVAGAALALGMLRLWPNNRYVPTRPKLAGAIVGLGALATLASVGAVAHDYPRFLKLRGLIPQAELPKNDAEGRAQSATLVERFPDDPRTHYYRAMALTLARDITSAQREFTIAMTQADGLRFYLGNLYANMLHVLVASNEFDSGRVEAAKIIARAACEATGPDQPPEPARKLLTARKLCD